MAKTNTSSPTGGHDPQKHGNSAQWAAVGIAILLGVVNVGLVVYFHSAESNARTSDEHVNSLISAKLKSDVEPKLSEIGTQLNELKTEAANIKKAVETLSDNQPKETQKTIERLLRAARQEQRPDVASRILNTATSLVAVLRKERETASPDFFDVSIKALNGVTSKATEAAFSARLAFANYRSSLEKQPTQIAPPRIVSGPLTESILRGLPALTTFEFTRMLAGTEMFGVAGIPARQRTFSNTNVLFDTVNFWTLNGASQTLDGIHWHNVSFIGAHIIYLGGDLDLQNVRFIDCTFEVPARQEPTPRSQQFVDYAALRQDKLIFGLS
jgi:hypothetical protein